MPFDPDAFYYIENEGLPYALAKEVGSSFLIRGSDPSKWPKIKPALSTKVWCNGSRISKEKAFAMAAELSVPKPEKFSNLNMGLDPDLMSLGFQLAGSHIEAGTRAFGQYVKVMVEDLGDIADKFKPYFRSWYEAIRLDPDVDDEGMTPYAEVTDDALNQVFEEYEAEKKDDTTDNMTGTKEINDILGEKGFISNEIDERKWELIRPKLKKAWDHAVEAGINIKEFGKILVQAGLDKAAVPYLRKFLTETLPTEKKDATTDNKAEPGQGETRTDQTGDAGEGTESVPGTEGGQGTSEGPETSGTSPVEGGDFVEDTYFESEGLPYAIWTDSGKSFLMRGTKRSDWFEINSDVVAKVQMSGDPISEEEALAMSRELSVPEPEGDLGSLSWDEIPDDDPMWVQSKPLFQKMLDSTLSAGKSVDEFIKLAGKELEGKAGPYFEKFVREELGEKKTKAKKEESKEAVPQNNSETSDHQAYDPEDRLSAKIMETGIGLAGFFIEAGIKDFADFTEAMITNLVASSEKYKPYFRSWYEAIRYCPGFDTKGMTPAAELDEKTKMKAQPLVYPKIDRSKFIPLRSRDYSYGEGTFRDGRPYRAELWYDTGHFITCLTFFVPRIGIEGADEKTLSDMLVSEGLIDFHDDRFHNSGYSSINLEARESTDGVGNKMWAMTAIVTDQDSEEYFVSNHVAMSGYTFRYARDGKPEEYLVALMDEDGNYQPYFVNNSDEPIELMRVEGSDEYKDIAPRSFVKLHFRYQDWYFDWVNEINIYLKTKDEEFYLCFTMRKYFISDFLAENGKLDEIPVINKPGLIVD